MNMRLWPFVFVFGCALVGWPSGPAWAQASSELEAEEGADERTNDPPTQTLADRIPSVTRRVFAKAGRAELSPSIGFSFSDPFFDTVTAGASLMYHVAESVSVGLSGDAFLGKESPLQVSGGIPTNTPYNRPTYAARLELGWAPVYGKLSLLAESVLHFDTYVSVGAAVIGTSLDGSAVGASLALGQRVFLADWFALKFEVRDHLFPIARAPGVQADRRWENYLTASVGFCFYVPPDFEREAL